MLLHLVKALEEQRTHSVADRVRRMGSTPQQRSVGPAAAAAADRTRHSHQGHHARQVCSSSLFHSFVWQL
ncbi:hypothetical protein PybrP1_008183 [[Pythium] brassicae (nom. inval.)]|nr:hypothetical protein PybrP1_008183 [[Pythium] brassicae (nom. inval.)]